MLSSDIQQKLIASAVVSFYLNKTLFNFSISPPYRLKMLHCVKLLLLTSWAMSFKSQKLTIKQMRWKNIVKVFLIFLYSPLLVIYEWFGYTLIRLVREHIPSILTTKNHTGTASNYWGSQVVWLDLVYSSRQQQM